MDRGGKLDKKECNGTPVQEAGPGLWDVYNEYTTHTRREIWEDGQSLGGNFGDYADATEVEFPINLCTS